MLENMSELYESFVPSELFARCERKYRTGRERFFCVFAKADGGKTVLCAANPLFCRLIGEKHPAGSRAAEDILPRESCVYLDSLYKLGNGKNKTCRFITEGRNGNVYLVESIFLDGKAAFSGERIKDPAAYFRDSKFFSPSERASSYMGAMFVSTEGNSLTIRSCSEKITEEMSDFAAGNDVRKAFGKYRCAEAVSEMIRQSLEKNTSSALYVLLGEDCCPVKICVHPMITKDGGRATLTLERCEPVCGTVSDLACCEIRNTTAGLYIIADMNDTMSELLKSGRVSLSDICGGANEGPSEKRIKTADGTYRSVRYTPKYSEYGKSCIVTINLVPKAAEFRKLSSRENHALYLAAKGNPNKYIAHVMNISEGTVKKMLHDGYKKLGISSRVELVKLYEEKLREK